MKLFLGALIVLSSSMAYSFEEGSKVFCNSELVISRAAHLDQVLPVAKVNGDNIEFNLLSQDLVCGRKQDQSGRNVYQWFSQQNRELPYIVDSFYYESADTTRAPREIGYVRFNRGSEIQFSDASPVLLSTFPRGTWFPGNVKLVTLKTGLSDILGSAYANYILSGRVSELNAQLVFRRDNYRGGERFILNLKRDAQTGRIRARLIK